MGIIATLREANHLAYTSSISNVFTINCGRVVVLEGEREGTQGYQLRLETAPVLLFCRFLITGIEPHEKLEGTGKEEEEEEDERA